MNSKEIKRVIKRKRKVTKLVMKITSVLKRSYHCKVAPSPATVPFDSSLAAVAATAPFDSSLAAAVAMAPFDSGFGPRQRRHLIRAQLVSQLIRIQLVLLD